jgi:hypothetical protein
MYQRSETENMKKSGDLENDDDLEHLEESAAQEVECRDESE